MVFDYQILLLIFVSFITMLLAVIVLLRSNNIKVSIFFFLHALFVAFWALGIAGFLYTANQPLSEFFVRFYYFSALCISIFINFFSGYFSSTKRSIINNIVICITIILSLYILFTDIIFESVIAKDVVELNLYTYFVFTFMFFTNFFFAMKNFYVSKNSDESILKQQSEIFFWGYLSSSIIGVTFNLILPWFGNYELIWVGPTSALVFVSATSYAIIKHHLFDIRLALFRTIAYFIAIGVLGISFAIVISLVTSYIVDDNVSFDSVVLFAISSAFFAIFFQPFKLLIDRTFSKIFYLDTYNTQETLDELNGILVKSSDVGEILSKSSEFIVDNFYSDKAKIHLFAKNLYFHNDIFSIDCDDRFWKLFQDYFNSIQFKNILVNNINNSEIKNLLISENIYEVIKMEAPDSIVGCLMIGKRSGGKNYSNTVENVLCIIADQIAISTQSYLRLKEIERFNETLQQNVKKATTDLQKSNDKLKSLDEAKDEFISMASHQLRTPLTSVKGYISMLLEGDAGPITDQQKTFLSQAFTSSQRMVYLIADLLNVSRLKTGKFVIEPSEVDLPQVVQTEVEQLQTTAAARGLTLKVDCPKDFPTLMLDETKIHQVIMNYIDNAIYYTPSGGSINVVLNVTKKTAELRVIDTGIGVPKKSQHELFTKFFRADNAQKARPDGTGLGLYMAKKVIIAQGGSVIFSSIQDKGSTFGFSFALNKVLPNTTDLPK